MEVASAHAAALVTADDKVPGTLGIEVSCRRVLCVSGSGMVKERIRLNRKNPCTPCWFWDSMSSTGVEEVVSCGVFVFLLLLILRGGVAIRIMRIWFLLRSGLGLDDFLGSAHTSRSACL